MNTFLEFLTALSVNFLILSLSAAVLKEEAGILHCVFSAAIGSVITLVLPFLKVFAAFAKLVSPVIMLLLYKHEYKTSGEFFRHLTVFYTVYFAFLGAQYFVADLFGISENFAPISVAVAIIGVFTLGSKLVGKAYKLKSSLR
ncbi:MAG: sigma-E processing peptidase SpoIIGA, partial [Christensenellaceae bacterium]|nr:sigma-E processing peptidase SpoIIGA [Christensenellaceae bacterium]